MGSKKKPVKTNFLYKKGDLVWIICANEGEFPIIIPAEIVEVENKKGYHVSFHATHDADDSFEELDDWLPEEEVFSSKMSALEYLYHKTLDRSNDEITHLKRNLGIVSEEGKAAQSMIDFMNSTGATTEFDNEPSPI